MTAPTAAVVAAVVAATLVCLWLLLRRGSIAHRAEQDYPDDEPTGPDDDATDDDEATDDDG